MKRKILILILVLGYSLLYGQNKKDGFLVDSQFKDFIPIPPIEYEAEVIVIDSLGEYDTISVKRLSFYKNRIIQFLPNEAVYVTITKIDSEGAISYGPASVSVSKGQYTVTLDYAKFTTLKVYDGASGSCDGFAKVGVGLRVTANIKTNKSNLDIGSLFGLGLAAKRDKLVGTLSVDVIGLESQEITTIIPLPSEISPSSIQTVLQSIATIKSKIYDAHTRLYPQIVSVKNTSGCTASSIIKQIDEKEIRYQTFLQQQQQNKQQQQQQQQRQN